MKPATMAVIFLMALLPCRAGSPVQLRGKWVLDAGGRAVGPDDFRRGLQTSGLAWRAAGSGAGELWAVGDQRSEFPGHILRIDPRTARLVDKPMRLTLPPRKAGESAEFEKYRSIRNSDFEGLTVHPTDASTLFAITEDKIPWIVEIRVHGAADAPAAEIIRLTQVRFPPRLRPWRQDSNFRLEGLTLSDDAKVLYLAFERADDDLPRLLSVPLASARRDRAVDLTELPVRFDEVPRRVDKGPARLNINGLQFLRWKGAPHILAVARDQERILLIDLEHGKVTRCLDLDLRDASSRRIHWVSPEGLALDEKSDRLWIINDPDSVRGNYRRRDEKKASGEFADYAPLLYEMKLSAVLGSRDGR